MMILENENEAKVIKNCLSILQSSSLPSLKGIDLFRFSKECEFLYDQVSNYEKKLKEESEKTEVIAEEKNIEIQNKKVKKV